MSMDTRTPAPPIGRGPKNPGVVYTGLALALVAVLAAVALTTRQPPPPTIAEFAPQAVEQIRQAPSEQQSSFGSAGAEGGAGAPARVRQRRTVATQTIDVARVRRCVGDPPRQIEDPQSPPCVPYWTGDNGGRTSPKGVTRDTITIEIPSPQDSTVAKFVIPDLEKFFNERFEFYGRKLRFVINNPGSNYSGTTDPTTQQATAQKADEQDHVFASEMYRTTQGWYYHEALARRRILSASGGVQPYDAGYLRDHAPWIWSYLPTSDRVFDELGTWACSRLRGETAKHAGDAPLQTRPRTFGIFLQTFYEGDRTTDAALHSSLARCGITNVTSMRNPVRTAGGDGNQATGADPASATNAVLQMRQRNVTSIFCLCQPYAAGTLMRAASDQGYHPEWLLSSYGDLDFNAGIIAIANAPADQMQHAFGITFQPRQLKAGNEPVYWAVKEVDPSFNVARYADSISVAVATTHYRPLLLLASAIQMAGPNLNPRTFAQGLQRAVFPNPVHPNMEGRVGFAPDRLTMTNDAAEFWWSNTAPSPYTDTAGGTFCYVGHGARHEGAWPRDDGAFFTGPCDSGA